MSDRAAIERAMRVVDPPPLTLDRFRRRRERTRRAQRVATTVAALAIFGAVVFVAGRAMILDRNEPANDTPVPRLTGIVLPDGDIVDPASGRSTGSLPIPGATDLSWSPDGAGLAYATPSGVFVLDVASGNERQIFPCGLGRHIGCTIAWSPDGGVVAVARGNALFLVGAVDGHKTLVRTFARDEVALDPSWSPAGDRIAFTLGAGVAFSRDLYTIRRDGSDLTKIVHGAPNGIGPWSPSWSPDGSRIAYIDSDRWDDRQWTLSVVTVGPDGSNRIVLMDAGRCYCLGLVPAVAWSPDGTRLALIIPPPGDELGQRSGLYLADADGTHVELVADGVEGRPAWRPSVRGSASTSRS